MYTTAEELFSRITELTEASRTGKTGTKRMLFELLQLTCQAGLRDTGHGFGSLAAQVDELCRRCHIEGPHRAAVRTARYHAVKKGELLPEDALYSARAVALLVSAVFETDIPTEVSNVIPHLAPNGCRGLRADYSCIRCKVEEWNDETISVATDIDGLEQAYVSYTDKRQFYSMAYLRDILHEDMQLNLIDCEHNAQMLIPRLIVVEPDYLIDISSLAACFEDYGHHPLSHLVNRMKPKPNNRYTILGNLAGQVLDNAVNTPQATLSDAYRCNFRDKALEYATCDDLDIQQFKQEAQKQAVNIGQAVDELFNREHIDQSKAILEPTFVCEKLGLQGRIDLMTTDMKIIVEQKAGKNMFIERNTGVGTRKHIEKHFVQALLYAAIMKYSHGIQPDIYMLYSRYPATAGLLHETFLQQLFAEAMQLRNEIVAIDHDIAMRGIAHYLPQLTVETLNTQRLDTYFFHHYLKPQLEATLLPIHQLLDEQNDNGKLSLAYFCEMADFTFREMMIAKTGSTTHGSSQADLWNMPFEEKVETGNILIGRLTQHDSEQLSFRLNDNIASNFRKGDMVCLYQFAADTQPDAREHLLLKGNIAELTATEVTIHLTNPVKSPLLKDEKTWAIEHIGSDITSTAALHGLWQLLTAQPERRDLLLTQREPRHNSNRHLSRSYDPDLDPILTQALQAEDYFLLIGPPGTGKTSRALRFIVEEELQQPNSCILLTAYTNRAVDEICGMLTTAGHDYIRIGNPYACDPRYRDHLIGHIVEKTPKLTALRERLQQAKIIVATTATLSSKPFIFHVRHFSLCVVDEASQILEPNIVGLLSLQQIERFILIGDHKQLPAVVQQPPSATIVRQPILRNIGITDCRQSLFERLLRREQQLKRTLFTATLHRQGRMHPDIAHFPMRQFYPDTNIEPVPLPHQQETSQEPRLVFIPSKPCRSPEQSDKTNTDEARIVAEQLRHIYQRHADHFDPDQTVGIIVPYRNQITQIRQEIAQLRIPQLADITIDTVERFQGSQRDVIIYSFTIQTPSQLEFLTANTFTDRGIVVDRKLNVALTRARQQLILIGNTDILRRNPIFANLIDYIAQK